MSLLDELLGRIFWNGEPITRRGRMNFLGTAVSSIVDNEETGATDVTISGPMGSLPEPGAAGEALLSDGEDWVSAALPTGTPVTIGLTNHPGTATDYVRRDHRHAHGDQPGGPLHAVATESTAGFMSAADKARLDGLEGGSSSDAWPSECALVYDFTKPATVAISRSGLAIDVGTGLEFIPNGAPDYLETHDWITVGSPSGGDYPVNCQQDTGAPADPLEKYVQALTMDVRPGYALLRVCALGAGASWICVEYSSGSDFSVWFNLTTGAVGTTAGDSLLGAEITSDGNAGYVCDVLFNSTGGGSPQVYVCDADGSRLTVSNAKPAIHLRDYDRIHGTAGFTVFQQAVERIDNQGSRRGTAAWQDENEASQPPLFDGYTSLLPTAGAFFGGDHGGLGINAKRLRILDPAGSYDLIRQLSAPGSPWTLYIVCTKPDDDAAERILFNLCAETTREVSALFYDGDALLRDRNGATIYTADIAQPVGDGMHLFAFYYGGRTLRVGAADALGSIYTNHNICNEPFSVATLGGTGDIPFAPVSECRALMQLAVFVPMACAPLSDLDTAIRAKIATDFGVTTLLET